MSSLIYVFHIFSHYKEYSRKHCSHYSLVAFYVVVRVRLNRTEIGDILSAIKAPDTITPRSNADGTPNLYQPQEAQSL